MSDVPAVTDMEVLAAMVRYGGSFVSALGKAAQHADADNLARIKATWPEYWSEYSNLYWRNVRRANEPA